MTYPKGFLLEARVLGDESDAEAGSVQIRRALGRVHPQVGAAGRHFAGHRRRRRPC